uniref:SigE family RNA polymerase sigma factor n=1 Tax=Nonomuraea pusilla TaxID=46177 RepID=UPI0009E77D2D|nr:SigE family RNA polymerase sigma factor [Nonomuraea pusilla]
MQTASWEDEFREYVQARGPALLRAARQLTGHPLDAEDLLQNALTKTYFAWDRIQDRRSLDGYVRRAMVNINISQWRRRKVEEYPSEELPEVCVEPAACGEVHELLEQALEELPERMRAAVVLRYYEDMTEPEIARTLGISVGTVKSTVSRAMAKLRSALGSPAPSGEPAGHAGPGPGGSAPVAPGRRP